MSDHIFKNVANSRYPGSENAEPDPLLKTRLQHQLLGREVQEVSYFDELRSEVEGVR